MFTACAPHSQTSPLCFSLYVCLNQVSVSQEAHTIKHRCLTVTLKAVLKALTVLILEFDPGFYTILRLFVTFDTSSAYFIYPGTQFCQFPGVNRSLVVSPCCPFLADSPFITQSWDSLCCWPPTCRCPSGP